MKITAETQKAIIRRMLPPWCSSPDMAEILVRRFLRRQAFSLFTLSELTEAEGQKVLSYLEKIFAKDRITEAQEQVIQQVQREKEDEHV